MGKEIKSSSLPDAGEDDVANVLRGFKTYLVAECGLAPNTVAAYLRDVGNYVAWVPRFREATVIDVVGFIRGLNDGKAAAATVNRVLSSLRVFYRYLMKEGEVDASPLEFVTSAKKPSRLPDYLHIAEVDAIIESAAKIRAAGAGQPAKVQERLARDVAMLALAYGCGLRASELTNLRVADVDFTAGIIRVRGKGGRERLVPFGEVTCGYLKDYLTARKEAGTVSPYLFASRRREGGVSRKLLWEIVKRYAKAAGVQGVRPHLFRHTFAAHLIQAGADVRTVQELLGHANVTTTQIYAHLDTRTLTAAHKRFHPRNK